METGDLSRPPTAFAGDDFVDIAYAGQFPDDNGLDNAALSDRIGEFAEIILAKCFRGLRGLGAGTDGGFRRSALITIGFTPPASPINAARPRPNRDLTSSAIERFSLNVGIASDGSTKYEGRHSHLRCAEIPLSLNDFRS